MPIKEGCGDGNTSGCGSAWSFLRGREKATPGFLVSSGSRVLGERNKDAAGIGDAWLPGSELKEA